MDLYLQFGYGMIGHTRALLAEWGGGGVVLSPRDLDPEQLVRVSAEVVEGGYDALIDPQVYARSSDHARLTEHPYWSDLPTQTTIGLSDGADHAALFQTLASLNVQGRTASSIIPALMANEVADVWLEHLDSLAATAAVTLGRDSYLTIALSSEAIRDEVAVDRVVDQASRWPTRGCYVLVEQADYLVTDPLWYGGLLTLAAGLSLAGKRVIVGYQNHMGLVLAATGVDAICSGTWLNVRSFSLERFYQADPDAVSRRAAGGWYYAPQVLAEYKMPFLDTAQRLGVLDDLRTASPLPDTYSQALFAGPQPSTIDWGERNAFRHYLHVLRSQAQAYSAGTYSSNLQALRGVFQHASQAQQALAMQGVVGQDRQNPDALDAALAGLALLDRALGARLRRDRG